MKVSLNELSAGLQSALLGLGLPLSTQDQCRSSILFTAKYGYADIEHEAQDVLQRPSTSSQANANWSQVQEGWVYTNADNNASLWAESFALQLLSRAVDAERLSIRIEKPSNPVFLVSACRLLSSQGFANELRFQDTFIRCQLQGYPEIFRSDKELFEQTTLVISKQPIARNEGALRISEQQCQQHYQQQLSQGIELSEPLWELIQTKGLDSLVPSSELSRQGAGE